MGNQPQVNMFADLNPHRPFTLVLVPIPVTEVHWSPDDMEHNSNTLIMKKMDRKESMLKIWKIASEIFLVNVDVHNHWGNTRTPNCDRQKDDNVNMQTIKCKWHHYKTSICNWFTAHNKHQASKIWNWKQRSKKWSRKLETI